MSIQSRALCASVLFVLVGCEQGSVYDQPIPNTEDTKALLRVRDNLKSEDQAAWQQILMRKINPMAEKVTSKTVGEAITRMKAKMACMKSHNASKVPEVAFPIGDPRYGEANAKYIAAYNAEVHAYNACLDLPV